MLSVTEHYPLIAVALITLVLLVWLYRDLQAVKARVAACDGWLAERFGSPGETPQPEEGSAEGYERPETSDDDTEAPPRRPHGRTVTFEDIDDTPDGDDEDDDEQPASQPEHREDKPPPKSSLKKRH